MVSIRRILVPTDFSERGALAVRYAAELAGKFGAQVGDTFSVTTSATRSGLFEALGGLK